MKTKESAEMQEVTNVEVTNVELPTFSVDWEKLEKAKNTQSLNFEYLKLDEGEFIRCVFAGIFKQEVNGREAKLCGLYAKKGAFVTASHMIVQACEKLQPGEALEIIYKGTKSLGGGKSLGDYEVNKVIF